MNGRGVRDSEKPASESALPAAVALGEGDVEGSGRERRSSERLDVMWSVDCETEETFLYAAITNISVMGIFVRTTDPLPVGTHLTLRFAPPHEREAFALSGMVQWVNPLRPRQDNPHPGMGIRFSSLSPAERERIVEAIRTIAYLREEPRVRDFADGAN